MTPQDLVGDEWLDAKVAECQQKEDEACRKLDKPVRAGLKIERAEWSDGRAYIDDLHYFDVPQEVWHLQVNGWQIAAKWLMDRRSTTLSESDIRQYQNFISTIIKLISRMQKANMVQHPC